MTRWEYTIRSCSVDASLHDENTTLDRLGKDGWELVCAMLMGDGSVTFYFKRPEETPRGKTLAEVFGDEHDDGHA